MKHILKCVKRKELGETQASIFLEEIAGTDDNDANRRPRLYLSSTSFSNDIS